MECREIDFSRHAMQRMFAQAVSPEEVRSAIESGDIIADYPDDKPYPSVLMLSFVEDRPLHIVVGRDEQSMLCHVITVYVPDPSLWSEDFKTRR